MPLRSLLSCLPFLAIPLLSLANGGVAAAMGPPEKFDVFPAGMNGVKLYRIPGIVVTNRGTVLAYCEARTDTRADWGEIEIHLRRSTDGGKNWRRRFRSPTAAPASKGIPANRKRVNANRR